MMLSQIAVATVNVSRTPVSTASGVLLFLEITCLNSTVTCSAAVFHTPWYC